MNHVHHPDDPPMTEVLADYLWGPDGHDNEAEAYEEAFAVIREHHRQGGSPMIELALAAIVAIVGRACQWHEGDL